jgi:hypothetical protein
MRSKELGVESQGTEPRMKANERIDHSTSRALKLLAIQGTL